MIWEVDGQQITVLLGESREVRLREWTTHKKVIEVPAQMAKAETLWTIRNYLKGQQEQQGIMLLEERLPLFDTTWPVRLLASGQEAYIAAGVVYAYVPHRKLSHRLCTKLQERLLKQYITQLFAEWEVRLNLLLPELSLRKNKHRPYVLSAAGINFDRGLHFLPQELIAYTVCMAVADYGQWTTARWEELREKEFPRWKTFEKTMLYTYGS